MTTRRGSASLAGGAVLCLGLATGPLGAAAATAAEAPTEPKNVILMISDGAGHAQFDAASLYEHGTSYAQVGVDPATGTVERVLGTPGQVYEGWPVQLAQSHFSATGGYVTEDAWGSFDAVASGATDSAAAATALGTGVKTTNGTIGFTPDGERLLTVGEQAKAVGKSTGVVTSVPFNHATPAGFVAHNADRNDYQGLATEMIDSDTDVIMGGGHPNFTDAHTSRSSNYRWISQADFDRVSQGGTDRAYVDSKQAFEDLATTDDAPEKVFGLAQVAETLQYNRPGLANDDVLPYTDAANDVPELSTMAEGALNVLDANDEGFFLMVEGGAVDWAGHANQTTRLVEEQLAFNAAVESVDAWVAENSSWDETMVIVTADHETGYLSGPGADPTWTPLTGEAGQLPEVSWHSGGHTNQLVPFYAKGAGSEAFTQRATSWDQVRGAYLDNTAIGETIFDALGHAAPEGDATAALEARVPAPAVGGSLSLSVAAGAPVAFSAGTDGALRGALPAVTVRDTRSEVQARGAGWTASGTATEFRAGNRVIGADALRWAPEVLASENGATAGPAATLEAPASLASSDRTTRVGETVVGADLELRTPAGAAQGRYGSSISMTVFPQD